MDLVEIRKKARDRQKGKKAQAKREAKQQKKAGASARAEEEEALTQEVEAPVQTAPEPDETGEIQGERPGAEPVQEAAAPPRAEQSQRKQADVSGVEEPRIEPTEQTGEKDMAARSKDTGSIPAPAYGRGKKSRRMEDDGFASLRDVLQSQHEERHEDVEEEVLQILTFMLGSEEYGLNIMDIKEIVRPKEPTEVPKAPHYVLGIISLRGTIIPIFDVNRRLGLKGAERSNRSRVIVVKWQEHMFGLLVDSVVQVMDLPISRIDPPPEILGGVEGEFLRGVGKVEDRLIILLNLSRILAMDHVEAEAELELPSGARQR